MENKAENKAELGYEVTGPLRSCAVAALKASRVKGEPFHSIFKLPLSERNMNIDPDQSLCLIKAPKPNGEIQEMRKMLKELQSSLEKHKEEFKRQEEESERQKEESEGKMELLRLASEKQKEEFERRMELLRSASERQKEESEGQMELLRSASERQKEESERRMELLRSASERQKEESEGQMELLRSASERHAEELRLSQRQIEELRSASLKQTVESENQKAETEKQKEQLRSVEKTIVELECNVETLEYVVLEGYSVHIRFFLDYMRGVIDEALKSQPSEQGGRRFKESLNEKPVLKLTPLLSTVEFDTGPFVEFLLASPRLKGKLSDVDCHSSSVRSMVISLDRYNPDSIINKEQLGTMKDLFHAFFGMTTEEVRDLGARNK